MSVIANALRILPRPIENLDSFMFIGEIAGKEETAYRDYKITVIQTPMGEQSPTWNGSGDEPLKLMLALSQFDEKAFRTMCVQHFSIDGMVYIGGEDTKRGQRHRKIILALIHGDDPILLMLKNAGIAAMIAHQFSHGDVKEGLKLVSDILETLIGDEE